MSRFTRSRTKRRTAFAVLLVWLFAVAAGWANACAIQERQTHVHVSSSDSDALWSQATRVSPGHLGVDSDHPEHAGAAKSACLKVCDDGTQTIVKLTTSVDLTDAAIAPLGAFLAWDPHPVKADNNAIAALPAPSPGPPVRTRFSRLAL